MMLFLEEKYIDRHLRFNIGLPMTGFDNLTDWNNICTSINIRNHASAKTCPIVCTLCQFRWLFIFQTGSAITRKALIKDNSL